MDSPERRIALLLLSFLFLMACFYTQDLKLEQKFLAAREADFRLAETTYMPPNEVARVLSLGYEPFMADVTFMAANSYFATHLIHDRKYVWLDTYIDAVIGYCRDRSGHRAYLPPNECEADSSNRWVTGLFPFNPRVYLWASQVIKFAPLLTDDIIDRSVYYGKTGIHFCPDNWELYFDVGFNLFFEYRDVSREKRQRLKREALDYFAVAAVLPNSNVDPNFVAGTMWDKDETERAIKQIYLTYYHATPRQRAEIRSRARAYGNQELAGLFERDEERWQVEFPYIPQSLFHVLAARYEPGFAFATEGEQ